MNECEPIINNTEPLRQGDIIRFEKKGEDEQFGIIVTGDCDIAHNKCKGIISYCNITTARWYILADFLKEHIYKELARIENIIKKNVEKELDITFQSSTFDNLISRENLDLLGLTGDTIHIINQYKLYLNKDLYSLEDYKHCISIIEKKDIQKKMAAMNNKIQNHLNSLPGDKFLITELPNQDTNYGYIVYLRFINTLKIEEIMQCNSHSQVYRIGRLNAPFLYHLTRKLAAVFSDIGLPETYENNRLVVSQLVLEGINK